jgi:uncharacterized membrane protein YkvI
VLAATIILPTLRHVRGPREATVAGLLCGPLAIAPALLFFLCMTAFFPEIGNEPLPSNFMLEKLHMRTFQIVFQLMILAALLESGTGSVHAVNERIARAVMRSGSTIGTAARFAVSALVLVGSIVVADRFGLVALIARGYRALAVGVLLIFVAPLVTFGVWQLRRKKLERGAALHELP